ncbi:GtrA family protein [Enterovirga sp.]|uniref:GtrA family protein n=1 Tax=Enterovirga sp. TaxID=2026350 RepID=UPI002D04C978|nr:GtrA family protein [Enterovirga sp.]HMO28484.1 GtrA family protein [Enterovirga sp.]
MRRLARLGRQFGTFFLVGIVVTATHYAILVALVEGWRADPVRATLVGYVVGGIASYLLHRRVTYASDRPHVQATWRFLVVWLVGMGLTWGLMALLVRSFGTPYLLAQLATSGLVLFWSFGAHKMWTFRTPPVA